MLNIEFVHNGRNRTIQRLKVKPFSVSNLGDNNVIRTDKL